MKHCKIYISCCLLFIATAILLFNGCTKENTDKPLAIPSSSTMAMDFSSFTAKKTGSILITNWQYSALNVAFWNTLLYINCAVPVAAYQEAVEQKAEYVKYNTWEWKYKVVTDSITINARLQGKLLSDSVEWKMYISTTKSNVTGDDFMWFTGKSAVDQSGGWWILYENPSKPNQYLKIDWKNTNDQKSSLKYTLVKPNDVNKGSYIEYAINNNADYNASYIIYGKLHNDITTIEWNSTSKEGHIKSPMFFNNTDWHCWNSSLGDVECGN